MFQNFNNFDFMFNRMAQKLTITTTSSGGYDDEGYPIKSEDSSVEVNEPLFNTQNPNTSYTNTDGGQYPTSQLYWSSKHSEFDKGTKVTSEKGITYEVTAKSEDIGAELTYYTLKKVGDENE